MKYYKQLDGLRFVAVLLVLIEHFAGQLGKYFSAGYYGVDLFFVISGFLITKILLRSNESFAKTYKKFIGRRTIRIFPIYYLTIFILFIIGNEYVHRYLIYCITYTYNYAWVYFNIPINLIIHFWSLCVEEQFYLFWPLIIIGFRKSIKVLKFVVILLITICIGQIYFNLFPLLTPYNHVSIIPQAISLGIGALGAILNKTNKIPPNLLENKRIEYFILSCLFFFLISDSRLKFLACPIISLFLVLKTTHQGYSFKLLNNFLNHKLIVYIGSISYGIYLYHLPLGHYITEYLFNPFIYDQIKWSSLGILNKLQWNTWLFKLPIYSLLSIMVAHFSYQYFEKPLLLLKDKWFKY